MSKELTREQILLRAALQIFRKTDEGHYVVEALMQTAVWDGVECVGGCWMEEAQELLEDSGIDTHEDHVSE